MQSRRRIPVPDTDATALDGEARERGPPVGHDAPVRDPFGGECETARDVLLVGRVDVEGVADVDGRWHARPWPLKCGRLRLAQFRPRRGVRCARIGTVAGDLHEEERQLPAPRPAPVIDECREERAVLPRTPDVALALVPNDALRAIEREWRDHGVEEQRRRLRKAGTKLREQRRQGQCAEIGAGRVSPGSRQGGALCAYLDVVLVRVAEHSDVAIAGGVVTREPYRDDILAGLNRGRWNGIVAFHPFAVRRADRDAEGIGRV